MLLYLRRGNIAKGAIWFIARTRDYKQTLEYTGRNTKNGSRNSCRSLPQRMSQLLLWSNQSLSPDCTDPSFMM